MARRDDFAWIAFRQMQPDTPLLPLIPLWNSSRMSLLIACNFSQQRNVNGEEERPSALSRAPLTGVLERSGSASTRREDLLLIEGVCRWEADWVAVPSCSLSLSLRNHGQPTNKNKQGHFGALGRQRQLLGDTWCLLFSFFGGPCGHFWG